MIRSACGMQAVKYACRGKVCEWCVLGLCCEWSMWSSLGSTAARCTEHRTHNTGERQTQRHPAAAGRHLLLLFCHGPCIHPKLPSQAAGSSLVADLCLVELAISHGALATPHGSPTHRTATHRTSTHGATARRAHAHASRRAHAHSTHAHTHAWHHTHARHALQMNQNSRRTTGVRRWHRLPGNCCPG